jgi:hypothetical protein
VLSFHLQARAMGCHCERPSPRPDLDSLRAFVLAERLGPSDQRLGIHPRRRQLSKVPHADVLTPMKVSSVADEGVRGSNFLSVL